MIPAAGSGVVHSACGPVTTMRSFVISGSGDEAPARSPRRHQSVLFVSLLVLLSTLGFPTDAQTNEEIDDIREERRRAQEQQVAQAGRVDAANAEVGELTLALEILQGNVIGKEGELSNARLQLEQANIELAAAEGAVLAKEEEIVGLRDQMAARAITSFVNQDDGGSVFVQTADPTQAARMQLLVEEVTQTDIDVGEDLRAAEEDLEVERGRASNAAAEALRLESEIAQQLVELEAARDLQNELTIEAELRLEHLLVELAAIEELDADLARQESAALDELARELARERSNGGGAIARTSTEAIPIPPNHEIVSANGYWVHESIAANVEAMTLAAEADGINLGGGGWRDSQRQIELRQKHCGTSDYAVYEMPSSQCSPPTARPGASMHERGLALDLTCDGALIGRRDNRCFRWLAEHANSYGFYNLPSEPWHWSTNGR